MYEEWKEAKEHYEKQYYNPKIEENIQHKIEKRFSKRISFKPLFAGVSFLLILTISFALIRSEMTTNPLEQSYPANPAINEVKNDAPISPLVNEMNEWQKELSFELRVPDFSLIPDDIKSQKNMVVKTHDLDRNNTEDIKTFHIRFGGPRKSISIMQTIETGTPGFLDSLQKEYIQETPIFIEHYTDSYKIFTWKDGMYYLVKGEKVEKDILVQITASLLHP